MEPPINVVKLTFMHLFILIGIVEALHKKKVLNFSFSSYYKAMGRSSNVVITKMRAFFIVLLIFLIVLGYLLIRFNITETKRIAEGKSLYERIGETAPKCWLPERKALFSVGCPGLTDEVRTELAIILSSCVCEAKGLPDVVCEKSKLGFCHQNRNCLYECGMKYGIHVSVPRMGYNVFEKMFDTIPFMCEYIVENNNFQPP